MKGAGVNLISDFSSISVVGLVEVLPRFFDIIKTFRKVKKFILEHKPRVVVLIDYPGFNLHLARILKKNKIPLLYYVPPQLWAWNKKRIKTLFHTATHVVVIFPFEKKWYEEQGYQVDYFGHPLMEFLEKKQNYKTIKKEGRIVGILPGSRESEVKRILPVMLRVAERLRKENVRFVLALAPGVKREIVSNYISRFKIKIEVWEGDSLSVIKNSDLLLVASGTATLEAAYFETPMIIIYKLNILTYLIAKLLVKTSWIGLVNIIAGEEIAPEFIQGKAEPAKISKVAMRYLNDDQLIQKVKEKMRQIKNKLKGECTSLQVAKIALKFCKEE